MCFCKEQILLFGQAIQSVYCDSRTMHGIEKVYVIQQIENRITRALQPKPVN